MNGITIFLKRLAVSVIDILTSKKAIAAGVGALVNLLVKDPGSRQGLEAVIMAYIVGQGIADHGAAIAESKLGLNGVAPLPVSVAGIDPTAPKPPAMAGGK